MPEPGRYRRNDQQLGWAFYQAIKDMSRTKCKDHYDRSNSPKKTAYPNTSRVERNLSDMVRDKGKSSWGNKSR